MKKKYIKQIAILLITLIFYFYNTATAGPTPSTGMQVNVDASKDPTPKNQNMVASTSAIYTVLHVVDGDTFSIMVAGKKETIRLIGIDTPEVVDPRKPVQCYGKEASEKAKEVLIGKSVTLTNDPTQGERDKYKRLLRYAYLEDGTHFNEYMIREGYAHEFTYQSNPYQFQREFKDAEIYARKNKKGLWADEVCN